MMEEKEEDNANMMHEWSLSVSNSVRSIQEVVQVLILSGSKHLRQPIGSCTLHVVLPLASFQGTGFRYNIGRHSD